MKKVLLLFSLSVLIVSTLQAVPVSSATARRAATAFLQGQRIAVNSISDISDRTPYREFYTFSVNDGQGFILVAGDDCVLPILGYSATNAFATEKMPAHVADWLQVYEEEIAFYKARYSQGNGRHRTVPQAAEGSDDIRAAWQRLLDGDGPMPPQNTGVSPLLTTTWDQSPYYNNSCPGSGNSTAVAGCVATATAQVMKYWNHPATGYGSHSYTHNTYGTLSANFGSTSYAWTSMPNALSASSTTAQVNAVATLIYHIGVAVEMDYSTSSSGSQTTSNDLQSASAENALKTYFKYSPALHSVTKEDYSEAAWCALLENELDNSRPILYSGRDTSGGHAFVLDGYNAAGQFHINWGWGGWCDGYYTMGDLHPASGGTGGNSTYTFNLNNKAVVGIQPNSNFGNSSTITVASNNTSYGTVSGGGQKAFGDTVTLSATAATGCRFVQWNDGDRHNSRQFLATGGTMSFTATFEPLTGDTLGYCVGNGCVSSLGTGSGGTWGIRLPASVLTNGHNLEKVQFYAPSAATYSLTVYTGTSSPSTTAATATFTATAATADQWNTITLPSAVAIDGTQSVWITFACSDAGYPAAMTYGSGNDDGMLWGSSFYSIYSSWNYTWMIRGIFAGNGGDTPGNTGDTLSYCGDSTFVSSIGVNDTTTTVYWGIRIPAAQLAGRNSVSSVLLYVPNNYGGDYTLRIYQGGTTAPQTLLHTQVYSLHSNLNAYKQCIPSQPVSISSTQDLWVVFSNADTTYPASACNYMGDANSDWISLDGTTWAHCNSDYNLPYSWMIKCITSSGVAAPSINIEGPRQVIAGETATFTANATSGTTIAWTLQGASPSTASGLTASATWSTAGTYTVSATATNSNGSSTATHTVEVISCDAITSYPFTMGFEADELDDLACWHFTDNDDDGNGWTLWNDGHSGQYCAASASYINNVGELTPDNWMVLPQMQLASGNSYELSWYTGVADTNYYQEHYGVFVSTTGTNPSDFTLLQQYTIANTVWTQHTLDLSAYAGQTVYIAFRHYSVTDIYWMLIDDIAVTEEQVETPTHNVSFMCTGNGDGSIYAEEIVSTVSNLCGLNFDIAEGDTLTIIIYPYGCERPEHFYVNNVDRIDNLEYYGSDSESRMFIFSPTEATTINVVFTKYTYNVTANVTPSYMGVIDGTGTYNCGDRATLTATPTHENYRFVQWADGVTDNPRTVIVNDYLHFTAVFEELEGIDEADTPAVNIYPNPSDGTATLLVGSPARVTLMDINGRTLMEESTEGTLTFSGLQGGIYLVRIATDNYTTTKKMIVK